MKTQENLNDIVSRAVSIIESGGVVILPADTVYGIFGNAMNEDTIERVYRIKGRKRGKPFGIVSVKEKIADVVELNDTSRQLINKCWPAPISVIAQKKHGAIPEHFSGDEPGLLVVCAQNIVLSKIVEKCSVPIFSTTCNLSGADEARTNDDLEPFRLLVDLVIENEYFDFAGKPSTIVNTMNQRPVVVREGAYPIDEIISRLDAININTGMLIQ